MMISSLFVQNNSTLEGFYANHGKRAQTIKTKCFLPKAHCDAYDDQIARGVERPRADDTEMQTSFFKIHDIGRENVAHRDELLSIETHPVEFALRADLFAILALAHGLAAQRLYGGKWPAFSAANTKEHQVQVREHATRSRAAVCDFTDAITDAVSRVLTVGETLGSTPLSAADFEKALRDLLQKSTAGRSARVLQYLEEQRTALSEETDQRVRRLFDDHAAQHKGMGLAEVRATFFQQKLTKGVRTAIVAKRLLEQTDAPEFEALRHAMIVPGDLLPDGTTHLKIHFNKEHTKKVNGPIFGVGFDGVHASGAPAQAAVPSVQLMVGGSGGKKAKTASTSTAATASTSAAPSGPPAATKKRPAGKGGSPAKRPKQPTASN